MAAIGEGVTKAASGSGESVGGGDGEGGSWHLTGDYEDYNTLCGLFTRLPGRVLDGQVIIQKLLK